MKLGFNLPSTLRGEDLLKKIDGRLTLEDAYAISIPCEHEGSRELKNHMNNEN